MSGVFSYGTSIEIIEREKAMNIAIRQHLSALMMMGSLLLGSQAWANTSHDGVVASATHCDSSVMDSDQSMPCNHSSATKQQPKATMDYSHHAMPMDMRHMDHSKMQMPLVTPAASPASK